MNLTVENIKQMSDYTFDRDYRLKLSSKKLKSGKCQVKFYATVRADKNMYGYVLAEAEETLRDVVGKIKIRLDQVKNRDSFHHINLYTIGKRQPGDTNILIFEA
ncbi:MAG: hypothetical protein WBA74_07105 [Cyclobacteriaceae bacterium]